MKNMIFTASLMSTILLGGTLTTLAADSEAQTNSTIKFVENVDSTEPVNPLDPSQPEDPNNPTEPDNDITGNNGPLSLDVVPSGMNFGTQVVSFTDETYFAEGQSKPDAVHFLQVTDARDASQMGWNISVSRTEFEDAFVNGGTILPATLSLPENRTVRNSLTATPSMPAPDFIPSLGKFEIPVGATKTLLSTNSASTDEKHGKGTTTYTWIAAEEELTIGAGMAMVGDFSSTINWSLLAGPGA